MIKNLKRLAAEILLLAIGIFVCGCGAKEPSPYEGTYHSMKVEVEGYSVLGESASGATIVLGAKGKGTITIQDETTEMTWTENNRNLSLKETEKEYSATVTENTICFEDFMGQGVKVTFGKAGTEAEKISFYFSEEEKEMIGTWKSVSVQDVFGLDASEDVAADGMVVEVREDKTAVITRNGDVIGTSVWDYYEGTGYVDLDVTWEMKDGKMIVDYYPGEDWYTYTCEKEK